MLHSSHTIALNKDTIFTTKCWYFAKKCWHQQKLDVLGIKIYIFWNYLCVCTYVRTKFQVSSIILTSFRREVILPTPLPTKRTPKNPTQIKVNLKTIPNRYSPCFKHSLFVHQSVSWWPTSRIITLTNCYNCGKVLLRIGAALFYYKLGQVLL